MKGKIKLNKSKLLRLIIIALLGTISLLLFLIKFPLPILPSYLKIDFGDIPAIIAGLIFSPLAGIMVVTIKNILYFAISGSAEPIGVSASFISGVLFVLPVSVIYHKYKGVKSIVSGLITGTIIMALGMSVLNYFFILPAYGWFMGWDINDQFKWISVIAGILPFNIIKGIIVGLLFVPVFIRMKSWIERKQMELT